MAKTVEAKSVMVEITVSDPQGLHKHVTLVDVPRKDELIQLVEEGIVYMYVVQNVLWVVENDEAEKSVVVVVRPYVEGGIMPVSIEREE